MMGIGMMRHEPKCPYCTSTSHEALGAMANIVWYRCRACEQEFYSDGLHEGYHLADVVYGERIETNVVECTHEHIQSSTLCCNADLISDTDICAKCRDHAGIESWCEDCGARVTEVGEWQPRLLRVWDEPEGDAREVEVRGKRGAE